MLSTKMFTIQTFFLQVINYFNRNNFVKAVRVEPNIPISPAEINLLALSEVVKEKVCRRDSFRTDCFPPMPEDNDYVILASFKSLISDIQSLDKKLSVANFNILTWNTDDLDEDPDHEVVINKQHLKFDTIDRSKKMNTIDVFRICLKKTEVDTLFEQATAPNFQIKVMVVFPSELKFCLLTINTRDLQQLNIYWPLEIPLFHINEMEVQFNYYPYFRRFESILMYSSRLIRQKFDNESVAVIKNNDEICLHFDKSPTVLLYDIARMPSLLFVHGFVIKLEPLDRQNYNLPEVSNFKCIPSILVRLSKLNNSNQDELKLQFTEYRYKQLRETYFLRNEEEPIVYRTFYFNNEKPISSELNGIPLSATIKPHRKTSQKGLKKIVMHFDFERFRYKDEGYDELEKLIETVNVGIYTKDGLQTVNLDKQSLNIFNTKVRTFIIEVCFDQSEDPNISSLISKMKNRSGAFSIALGNDDQKIIETFFFLDNKKMTVMSTNRLREFLHKYHLKQGEKNKDLILLQDNVSDDEDILNKLFEKKEDNSPEQLSTGGGTTGDGTTGGGTTGGGTAGDGTAGGGTTGDGTAGGGTTGDGTAGKSGSQNANQDTSNGWTKDFVDPQNPILTSGNGSQGDNYTKPKTGHDTSSNGGQNGDTINTGGSQKSDDTKTTTPKDSNKKTSDSKPKDTDETKDSDDKTENEEPKSGSKTLIIIFVIVGILLAGGLAAYLFFS